MVAISPMVEKYSKQIKRAKNVEFDVLLDPGNETASKFGLRHKLPDFLSEMYAELGLDLVRFNGDESWTLPMSSQFVVDTVGVIRRAEFDPDYTRRPEPGETVKFVEELVSRGNGS